MTEDASRPEHIPDQAVVEARGVDKRFCSQEVLKGIDLTIARGEMVAIVGASGSGKSTLLNILGCLDQPSEGSYRVAGRETGRLTADALATLRREHFGFIFQRYHLLGDLSARDNVALPALYAGLAGDARKARAESLLQRLGLGSRLGRQRDGIADLGGFQFLDACNDETHLPRRQRFPR